MQEDALDILHWRNDILTRTMSRTDTIIDEERHWEWFCGVIADPRRLLLIGVNAGHKIGMVRFDHRDCGGWEVSITVTPEMRGKGMGSQLLKTSLAHFFSVNTDTFLLAEVKRQNVASCHLFESLGFTSISCEGDIFRYSLDFVTWEIRQCEAPRPHHAA